MSIINTALIGKLKKTKADKSNVLQLNNTTAFTPTANYNPATKKYVDDAVAAVSGGGGSITGVAYTASLTPPLNPTSGQMWFNQETGQTFQYHVDADGTYFWLETGSGAFTDTQYTLNESDVITVVNAATKTYSFNYYTGFVQIFINRMKLRKSEFTATNSTSVTINIDLDVGDEIEIVTLNVLQG